MLNDLIKEIRMDNGLTQEDLAIKFNMSRTAISKYETGEREPNIEFLLKFSNYFNVSVDYLLGKTKIPTPQYILNSFTNHSPDTLKKLNIILSKFKSRKYVELVYSLFLNIDNLK